MLLDASSSTANPPLPPPADRPARSEAPPKRDDDPSPSDDRRADAAQQSTQPSNGSERADDKDATNSAQDSKDAKNADKTDNADTDQKAADSTDNGAQLASVLTTNGVASADAIAATTVAPVEPMSVPNGATVAPPATSIASPLSLDTTQNNATPPSDQLASIQAASNSQSANAATPAEPAEPAKRASPATSATPATPAEPADKTEPAESTRGATPATPATPAKKAELAEGNTPAESNRGATPAIPATPAKKAETAELTAPAKMDETQAPANSSGKTGMTQADSLNSNAPPAITATDEEASKNDKTLANGERAKEQSHHSTAERTPGIETGAGNAANTIKGGAEMMQTPGPSMPAGQATIAPMQANTAPTSAAAVTVAVSLANLPIEIATQAKDGNNRFEIRLDPPELGRIDVRLDIDSNGQVTSRLVAERATTLDLLRRDAPQIERALQDAGLTTSDQGMQFSLRDQSFAGSDEGALPNATRLVLPEDDTATIEAIRQGYGRRIGLGGGIDIRV
jgi:flagellar hook-length control protein FliK